MLLVAKQEHKALMVWLRELEKTNGKSHKVAMEMEEKSWKIKKLVELKKADPKNEMFKSEEDLTPVEEEIIKLEATNKELAEKKSEL